MAVMVRELDVSPVADALTEIVECGSSRETLLEMFERNRQKFSWEETAEGFLTVIQEMKREAGV